LIFIYQEKLNMWMPEQMIEILKEVLQQQNNSMYRTIGSD
jgi:hypothetical protein